jgi:hypothetical protein
MSGDIFGHYIVGWCSGHQMVEAEMLLHICNVPCSFQTVTSSLIQKVRGVRVEKPCFNSVSALEQMLGQERQGELTRAALLLLISSTQGRCWRPVQCSLVAVPAGTHLCWDTWCPIGSVHTHIFLGYSPKSSNWAREARTELFLMELQIDLYKRKGLWSRVFSWPIWSATSWSRINSADRFHPRFTVSQISDSPRPFPFATLPITESSSSSPGPDTVFL